ncbi:MAG: Ppx/GppA phosphatase [Verrucomicrobiales bacterium]|nr:Ppx/GppA phosphatase [Verrucomicrobiales bacterium]
MKESPQELEVLFFMQCMEKEPRHTVHVCCLANQMVSGQALGVAFNAEERFILQSAALLHDIGWTVSPTGKKHHKESARMIRAHLWQTIPKNTVQLIAAVARYHRKSMPQGKHKEFAFFSKKERQIVSKCAAILRVADGLDRTHRQKVKEVLVSPKGDRWEIQCFATGAVKEEFIVAKEKADLAEKTFDVTIDFKSRKS